MSNCIYSLEHYQFIRVSGADRLSFLQGQVSCNTTLLSPERSLTGALCNLKGRVIADFRLLARGEDCIIQCAPGMADAILATLGKYAVFSKVKLELLDSSDATHPGPLGLIGAGVDAALAQLGLTLPETPDGAAEAAGCTAVRLPGPSKRVELWFHSATARADFLAASDSRLDDGLEAWDRADIEAGIVHVTKALSEEYTPQLLNYDISGLIDFKKGCYTGQEIVARMFYRGKGKKRLYLLSASVAVGPQSRVLSQAEASRGVEAAGSEIVRFSNSETPTLLLAVLASDAVAAGETFRLSDQADAELRVLSLPYARLDAEAPDQN